MEAKVFILPQILATEHFLAPGQLYWRSPTESQALYQYKYGSGCLQAPNRACDQLLDLNMTNPGWQAGQVIAASCITHSRPPVSQVTKKSFWQSVSSAPLSLLPTCPSEAVSLSSSTASHTACTEVSFHFCSSHLELQSLLRPER